MFRYPDATYYVYGKGMISQEIMNSESGTVTDRITYDPYGKVTSRTGATETIFLYVGQWGVQTDDNGLLYMRARYYSVELNRLINEDPIRDGLNWYGYAGNNPLAYVDPRGTEGIDPTFLEKVATSLKELPQLDEETKQKLHETMEQHLPKNSFKLIGRPVKKTGKTSSQKKSSSNTPNPKEVVINEWLIAYSEPSDSLTGRIVNIPEEADKSKWAMKEDQVNINYWGRLDMESRDLEVVVNIGENGEMTDSSYRYWIAVYNVLTCQDTKMKNLSYELLSLTKLHQ